jgi:arginine decarboxylase-like protein
VVLSETAGFQAPARSNPTIATNCVRLVQHHAAVIFGEIIKKESNRQNGAKKSKGKGVPCPSCQATVTPREHAR